MKPGVYYVEAEEYFNWDAVSNSRLSLLAKSPKHFKAGFKESTGAMRLGTLAHNGVLEPLSIIQRYAVMPDYSSHPSNTTSNGERSFSAATKFVKQQQQMFKDLHFDKSIVSQDEYDAMIGMATAINEQPEVADLFRDGEAEISIVWEDPCGLLCKARIDWLKKDRSKLVDLKTTNDAMAFEKSLAVYGYHRQMAFYQRGLAALGIAGELTPWIVAVEKTSPFGLRAAPMSQESLAIGWNEIDKLLEKLIQCQETNNWPGYDSPSVWDLPQWYLNQCDNQHLVEQCDF